MSPHRGACCSVAARRALRRGPLRPGRSAPMPSTLHYADHAERPPAIAPRRPSISAPTHADCHTALTRRIARTARHPCTHMRSAHPDRSPSSSPRVGALVHPVVSPHDPASRRIALTASAAVCGSDGESGGGKAAVCPRCPCCNALAFPHTHAATARHRTPLRPTRRAALPRTAPPWPSRNTARPAHSATTPNCAALPLAPHCTPPTAHCTAHATHRARPVPYCGHTARRNPMRHQARRALSTRAGTRESLTTEYKMCARAN